MSVFLYGIKPKPVDNNAESEQQPLTKKDPFIHLTTDCLRHRGGGNTQFPPGIPTTSQSRDTC